jgi:serine/threonine-protein kinase
MIGDQWERIKQVFSAALERSPPARIAFLDEACAGDTDLRREVEALLAAHDASDSFLKSPAGNIVPASAPVHSAVADGQTIGAYRILRTLGRGGMATVYLARDLRHHRSVALKVLHPDLAHALGPDRFLREIEVAANLSHPHILPLFDSGSVDGLLYYAMPYVEGETLRDRLRQETYLPVEQVLQIAREVADALAYAHGQGVIHRDIKPENILLSGYPPGELGPAGSCHALVADFGIARTLAQPDAARLTETGLAVGTAAYMSPEQASAASHIDGRSDVYSLACVVYEMLAGEPPHTGPTPQAILARRLTEAPRPLRVLRETVPEGVDSAVQRALAKVPADRFASMAEFARALASPAVTAPIGILASARRRLAKWARLSAAAALGLGFLIALGVHFAWWRGQSRGEAGSGTMRLAVLPFEQLGDSADAYFADGVTDAVRGKLAALPSLQVTARSSSSQYKQTTKSPRQIGEELGVQYILTGTVRWQKATGGTSRVQVSPELVQVSTASTKWQEPFEAPLTDVFQVQADVATRVARALGVALGAGERERLAERPTQSLAAYDAYLRGEEATGGLSTFDLVSLRRARAYYERAVALDPSFALAWSQLSRAHSQVYWITPTPAGAEAARQAAERALALAPKRPEGYLALGDYYSWVHTNPARALEQYARGQQLAPKDARLLTVAGFSEMRVGRLEDALAHLRQAEVLDPRSVLTAQFVIYALVWLRRYPEALATGQRALTLAPGDFGVIDAMMVAHLGQGDLAGARSVLRAVPRDVDPAALVAYIAMYNDLYWVLDDAQQRLLLQISPAPFGNDRSAWGLALAETHALRGDSALARAYADSARLAYEASLRDVPQNPQGRALLGVALAYLGRKADAIREGERAVGLKPFGEDASFGGYVQHQLVRIYLLVGEKERALDRLEPLLKTPFYLSPGLLKIDPTFAPLRGHPRFQRLVAETP